MALDEHLTQCGHCGAPRKPKVYECTYCGQPVSDELEKIAIPCWSCKCWNDWSSTHCERCNANLMVTCVDCQLEVPHHPGFCIHCGKPF